MTVFKNFKNRIRRNLPSSSFFTVAGFILILCLSWFYISQSPWDEEEQIHAYLQDQFQTLVSDFIAKKHPKIDEIIFHKIWTKSTPDPHRIKIFFNYSLFTKGESGGELLIKGEAILEKSQEQEEALDCPRFSSHRQFCGIFC